MRYPVSCDAPWTSIRPTIFAETLAHVFERGQTIDHAAFTFLGGYPKHFFGRSSQIFYNIKCHKHQRWSHVGGPI